MMNAIEETLQNLGTDYLDVYYVSYEIEIAIHRFQWYLTSPMSLNITHKYTNPANPVMDFCREKLAAPPCVEPNCTQIYTR